jgi:DNA-binding CsgD family transcriptional regulator
MPMTIPVALERGRTSFDARAWGDTYVELGAADLASALGGDDLERAATAAYLSGHDDDADAYWTRAHRYWVDVGDDRRAARCGFWLSFTALLRGDTARSAGWLARSQRLLGDASCAEQGYLLIVTGFAVQGDGHGEEALAHYERALALAEASGDPDLLTLARLGIGEVLVGLGRTAEGVRLLDEVMVGVMAGEVSTIPAGLTYCAVILCCRAMLDLHRAAEWTEALGDWCAAQDGLVPFQGQCLVHRSEILQVHGRWPEAAAEAERAVAISAAAGSGMALYQRAELHRLRGEVDEAEEGYRTASARGHDPQPGLALLRLGQGRTVVAASAIRRALASAGEAGAPPALLARARLLPAYVEIMLAADDVEAARAGADELARLVGTIDVPLLRGWADQAAGAVLLAEGDPAAALGPLTAACRTWQRLPAAYDLARARLLLGMACCELGDDDTGRMHLDEAARALRELGATPDLVRLERLLLRSAPGARGLLSDRELEVLRLVAGGRTNRGIADALFLSEKTVARHVSNILGKLGLPSRSAATAYAYEHDLV